MVHCFKQVPFICKSIEALELNNNCNIHDMISLSKSSITILFKLQCIRGFESKYRRQRYGARGGGWCPLLFSIYVSPPAHEHILFTYLFIYSACLRFRIHNNYDGSFKYDKFLFVIVVATLAPWNTPAPAALSEIPAPKPFTYWPIFLSFPLLPLAWHPLSWLSSTLQVETIMNGEPIKKRPSRWKRFRTREATI